MLQAAALVLALAAQEAVPVRVPYLQTVRAYGPGTGEAAVQVLRGLRLDLDRVFDELDRECRASELRSCAPRDIRRAEPEVRARILAGWRLLYPRVLGIHAEALVVSDVNTERAAMKMHRTIMLRVIARLDEATRLGIAPPAFARIATQGRYLLIWALQYHRDAPALAGVLDLYEDAVPSDVELLLARADLEELRASPDYVAAMVQRMDRAPTVSREVLLAQEEARALSLAVRTYEQVLGLDRTVVEAHLRLARVLARLGRLDAAEARLRELRKLPRDPRQAYLAALFLADVTERSGRRAEARTAYAEAQRTWPAAQAPAVGLARLRALEGAYDDARAALRVLTAAGPSGPLDRSDPWLGYEAGQAWRLPDALRAIRAGFEPLP